MRWPLVWASEYDILDRENMHLQRELALAREAGDAADATLATIVKAATDQKALADWAIAELQSRVAEAVNRGAMAEQRYHELVLKAMAPPPPPPKARVEDAPPEAEDRARQQASVESKLRLAEEIIAKAATQGRTIDYATAYREAETMYDHPELISLEA